MIHEEYIQQYNAYILLKGITIGPNTAATVSAANNGDKKVIFKNCAPFTDCISEINNTQVDNAKVTEVVMLMYNLIRYSDNYLKTPESLWQYGRDNCK